METGMRFYTTVDCNRYPASITYDSKMLVLGSCFSENIGGRLRRLKFNVLANPYGILYNPLSISNVLSEIIACKQYGEEDLVCHNGLYHSLMHSTRFSSADKEEALHRINSSVAQANEWLGKVEWLVITFGTSYVYSIGGKVVSNCHKMPEKTFTRSFCNHKEMAAACGDVLRRLFTANDKLKLILTVSPVRHLRDGLHGNMASKSNLVLLVDELIGMFKGRAFYFPSYEIMMDELRDYRFYADDMLHPSKVAIDYIWEKFTAMFMGDAEKELMRKCETIARMLDHKPISSDAASIKNLMEKIAGEIAELSASHPCLDFSEELNHISQITKGYGK